MCIACQLRSYVAARLRGCTAKGPMHTREDTLTRVAARVHAFALVC